MVHLSHHMNDHITYLKSTTSARINKEIGRLITLQLLQRQKGRRGGGDSPDIVYASAMHLILAIGNDGKMTIVVFAPEGAEGCFGGKEGEIWLEIKMIDERAGLGLHGDGNDNVGDGHDAVFGGS